MSSSSQLYSVLMFSDPRDPSPVPPRARGRARHLLPVRRPDRGDGHRQPHGHQHLHWQGGARGTRIHVSYRLMSTRL